MGLVVLANVYTRTTLPHIAFWLAVSGVGQGLFLAPNTRDVMSAVPAERSGEASGLIATTQVVGQTLSVAIAGALFVGSGERRLVRRWRPAERRHRAPGRSWTAPS